MKREFHDMVKPLQDSLSELLLLCRRREDTDVNKTEDSNAAFSDLSDRSPRRGRIGFFQASSEPTLKGNDRHVSKFNLFPNNAQREYHEYRVNDTKQFSHFNRRSVPLSQSVQEFERTNLTGRSSVIIIHRIPGYCLLISSDICKADMVVGKATLC